ncbi:hypothetical protein GHT06_007465 [Daphnia sinensis]|uniref:Uncharacterized protein n=1 Tax=Daphnia sinensis TaxID=1820382 RepID=A0AAD5KE07_9CRUS|nr:hypothetical protein GHT06_007465 [Daphnia sinensis]
MLRLKSRASTLAPPGTNRSSRFNTPPVICIGPIANCQGLAGTSAGSATGGAIRQSSTIQRPWGLRLTFNRGRRQATRPTLACCLKTSTSSCSNGQLCPSGLGLLRRAQQDIGHADLWRLEHQGRRRGACCSAPVQTELRRRLAVQARAKPCGPIGRYGFERNIAPRHARLSTAQVGRPLPRHIRPLQKGLPTKGCRLPAWPTEVLPFDRQLRQCQTGWHGYCSVLPMQLPCSDLKPLESEVMPLAVAVSAAWLGASSEPGCPAAGKCAANGPSSMPHPRDAASAPPACPDSRIEFEHAIQRVPGIDLQVQATQLQQRHIGAVQLLMEFQTLQTQMTRDRQFGRGVLPEIKANVHVQLPVCQSNRPSCRPIGR